MSLIINRLLDEPLQSFFLFGPRGTGKTTLLKSQYQDALWIDLLKPDVFRQYSAHPERLFSVVEATPKLKTVVIDEVQKVPALLSVVHSVIEEKRGAQFILTGSSARKLKQTGADLLGGRAAWRTLHPFMAVELGSYFSLDSALQNGLLPLLFQAHNPADTLQGYIHLYLREEIQAEGLVRNLESFSRFLEAISFSHGSLLNITNVARECEVKRKTVENYISILEDLLLAFQLPIFNKRAQRALRSHPKFYLFDSGVFQTLRPKGPFDRVDEIEGIALEGLVVQHLRAWNDYSREKHQIYFWRTRSGTEVDFIVYGPKGLWAIEVKNSRRVHPNDTKSLETFLVDYPEAQAILLYRGQEYLKLQNVLCMPCENFLMGLRPNEELISD